MTGITKAPAASAGAERRGRDPVNWDMVRGWFVGAGMVAGMVIYVLSWPPNEPPGLAFEGHWSETSDGFDLAGGDYAIAWTAPCELTVDLYAGDGSWIQTVEAPGIVPIAQGSWFWSVRGDCDWRITVDTAVSPT